MTDCILFGPSKNLLADILIKGLASKKFEELLCKLEMKDIYSPTLGGGGGGRSGVGLKIPRIFLVN